ncbi:MAG: hypothetical protein NTX27_16750 [Verrucomicrobia bacterium]|nr:hypothetical protein [Verrucomicrobiota bacterium]
MNPRFRAVLQFSFLGLVLVVLLVLFPRALAMAELAAMELRYFWWVILLFLLAIWFIWGIGKKPRN